MRRLYVGGLSHTVTQKDLKDRFGKFGEVEDVELRTRRDEDGVPYKTFSYININISDADLKKCLTVLNKSKWKGGTLQIEAAKESFLHRLAQERREAAEQRLRPSAAEDKRQKLLDSLSKAGVENFTMKAAVPGSEVPGHKDWVVSKFGRVLPVLQLRCQKGTKARTSKYDPSKYCHNIRRLDRNAPDESTPVTQLTWEVRGGDDAISKKRRGEFPPFKPSRPKKTRTDADVLIRDRSERPVFSDHHTEVHRLTNRSEPPANHRPARRERRCFSDSDSGEEIRRLVAAEQTSHDALQRDVEDDNLEVVGVDFLFKSKQKDDEDEEDYDSADTDELFASRKNPSEEKVSARTIKHVSTDSTEEETRMKKENKTVEEEEGGPSSSQQKENPSADSEEEESSSSSVDSDYEAMFSNVTRLEISLHDLQKLSETTAPRILSSASERDANAASSPAERAAPKKGITPEEILAFLLRGHSSKDEEQQKRKRRGVTLPAFMGTKSLMETSRGDEDEEGGGRDAKKQKLNSESEPTSEEEEKEVKNMSSPKAAKTNLQKVLVNPQTGSSSGIEEEEEEQQVSPAPHSEEEEEQQVSPAPHSEEDEEQQVSPAPHSEEDKEEEEQQVFPAPHSEKKEEQQLSPAPHSEEEEEQQLSPAPHSEEEEEQQVSPAPHSEEEEEQQLSPAPHSEEEEEQQVSPAPHSKEDEEEEEQQLSPAPHSEEEEEQQLSPALHSEEDEEEEEQQVSPAPHSEEEEEQQLSPAPHSEEEEEQQVSPAPHSKEDEEEEEQQLSPALHSEEDEEEEEQQVSPAPHSKEDEEEEEQQLSPALHSEEDEEEEEQQVSPAPHSEEDEEEEEQQLSPAPHSEEEEEQQLSPAPHSESSTSEEDEEEERAPLRVVLGAEEEEELQRKANMRRLAALEQRQKEAEEHRKLIQGALSNLDAPAPSAGKHIVFGSDEEEEAVSKTGLFQDSQSEEEGGGAAANQKEVRLKPSGPRLFADSEDDEGGDEEEDGSRFDIRPEFEGRAGQKLMALQSRFGTDERFRMDSRFLEDDEEEEEQTEVEKNLVEDDEALEEEKKKNLSILHSLLGSSRQTSSKVASKAKKFRDVSSLHYDPSKEEHAAFETKTDETKKDSKSARRKKREEAQKLPEVSKEIYYDVSGDLKAVFSQAKEVVEEKEEEEKVEWDQLEEEEGGGEEELLLSADRSTENEESSGFKFSFFGDDAETGSGETTEYKVEKIQAPKVSWHQDPRFLDSSSEEEEEEEEQRSVAAKASAKETPSNLDLFFFHPDDNRLKEGPSLFCRTSELEEQREEWEESRSSLKQEYRKKHRDARRKLRGSKKS